MNPPGMPRGVLPAKGRGGKRGEMDSGKASLGEGGGTTKKPARGRSLRDHVLRFLPEPAERAAEPRGGRARRRKAAGEPRSRERKRQPQPHSRPPFSNPHVLARP